jgi:fatty-acyl-CoA synthase
MWSDSAVLGLSMETDLCVPWIVRRAREIHGDRPVHARRPDRTWHTTDYATVVERAGRLGRALRTELGLVDGDRVATLCWNHAEHLEVYLGAPCARLVLHTLNLRLHPDDIAFIATHARDRVLVADTVLWPLVEQVVERASFEHVVAVGDSTPDGAIAYEELLARADGDADFLDVDERTAAAMCYTSGTTGRPKGVVYSHRAIVLHSLGSSLADTLRVSQRDTVLPVVPMFHANAWGLPYTCAMTGAGQVLPGPHLDPPALLEAFEQHRVTIGAGVPTIWMGLLQALDAAPGARDLSSVRCLVVGGSAVPRALVEAFEQRHGLEILHAWGMTETAPVGTVANPGTHEDSVDGDTRMRFRVKQGRPAPLVEIRARGEDGLVPWDGATMGELEIRGPWIAASYFEAPDAADRWTDDGWFRTGDIVTIDPTGAMEIQDRAKDLVKSGGEWISTVALENALMGHPAVAEAAVIAVPDDRWLERPLAVVVLREGAAATPDELRAFLEPHVVRWWIPERFEVVDEIPKTAVGKFKKTALRERFTS